MPPPCVLVPPLRTHRTCSPSDTRALSPCTAVRFNVLSAGISRYSATCGSAGHQWCGTPPTPYWPLADLRPGDVGSPHLRRRRPAPHSGRALLRGVGLFLTIRQPMQSDRWAAAMLAGLRLLEFFEQDARQHRRPPTTRRGCDSTPWHARRSPKPPACLQPRWTSDLPTRCCGSGARLRHRVPAAEVARAIVDRRLTADCT